MSLKPQRDIRLVIIGDTRVGKTSIRDQYVNHKLDKMVQPTTGCGYFTKQLNVNGQDVNLVIWDTAGMERFRPINTVYYHRANACILVYDVTKPETFQNINNWLKEFVDHRGISNMSEFPFLLLGNKSDLPDHAVQISEAQEFAQTNGEMLFYEVSAKTGDNIQTAFEALTKKVLEKESKEEQSYVHSSDSSEEINEKSFNLSISGLGLINRKLYANDFDIIFNNYSYSCPSFIAEFISPKISILRQQDQTIKSFKINLTINHIEKTIQQLENLLCGKTISLNYYDELINILLGLGNYVIFNTPFFNQIEI